MTLNIRDFDLSINASTTPVQFSVPSMVLTDRVTLDQYASESLDTLKDLFEPDTDFLVAFNDLMTRASIRRDHHDLIVQISITMPIAGVAARQYQWICKHVPIDNTTRLERLVKMSLRQNELLVQLLPGQDRPKKWTKAVSVPVFLPEYPDPNARRIPTVHGTVVETSGIPDCWICSDRVVYSPGNRYRFAVNVRAVDQKQIHSGDTYLVFYMYDESYHQIEGDGTFFHYPAVLKLTRGTVRLSAELKVPVPESACYIAAGLCPDYRGSPGSQYQVGLITLKWRPKD